MDVSKLKFLQQFSYNIKNTLGRKVIHMMSYKYSKIVIETLKFEDQHPKPTLFMVVSIQFFYSTNHYPCNSHRGHRR